MNVYFLQHAILTACREAPTQSDDVRPIQEIEPPVVSQETEPIPIVGDKEIWVETLFDESTVYGHISGTRSLMHQA